MRPYCEAMAANQSSDAFFLSQALDKSARIIYNNSSLFVETRRKLTEYAVCFMLFDLLFDRMHQSVIYFCKTRGL